MHTANDGAAWRFCGFACGEIGGAAFEDTVVDDAEDGLEEGDCEDGEAEAGVRVGPGAESGGLLR